MGITCFSGTAHTAKMLLLLLGLFACSTTADVVKTKVAILGGGMSGTMAAKTLARANISDFLIVEARPELGGRIMNTEFAGKTVELGAGWIEGLENNETGQINPIWDLALQYNLATVYSDYEDLIYYNESGPIDESFLNITAIFQEYGDSFDAYIAAAGYRQEQGLIDQNVKTGLTLNGWTAKSPAEMAVEWWEFDWEYGQPPVASSWVEAVNNYNYTFIDLSEENRFVIDQRGLKVVLEEEAKTFLQPHQVLFNTTVSNIAYDEDGVNLTATNSDGTQYSIEAEYVIVTFSVGVLQHDAETLFTPTLPDWKTESIQAFSMSTYTKIFISFPYKFWNDSQFELYIDPVIRGSYAIWQDLSLPDFLPDTNIIFVTVTDELSYIVESQPENVTMAEVMAVLANMYPHVDIPEPTGFLFPKWHSDPLFRGSYSNWPTGYPKALHDQFAAPVGRITFTGEATSYKYYGFMQGAYYEGIRAGDEVTDCLMGACATTGSQGPLLGCNGL